MPLDIAARCELNKQSPTSRPGSAHIGLSFLRIQPVRSRGWRGSWAAPRQQTASLAMQRLWSGNFSHVNLAAWKTTPGVAVTGYKLVRIGVSTSARGHS
ncbi:unnamed protein product [Arctia plantaginis]|uniref:Uncharacterized protein n=1 Tax=Arctia plantaginis TaxID=874455 RepID=A0A8S0ZV25_ARCPL|nr:unnamed protein product [Arctia plantaginis]